MASLSKDEVRAARLRALEGGSSSVSEDNPPPQQLGAQTSEMETDQATDPPVPAPSAVEQQQADGCEGWKSRTGVLSEAEMRDMHKLLWPVGSSEDDRQRWQSQGFVFTTQPPFGLQQGHGGPCGVLAAVQAEVLRYLLFTHPNTQTQAGGDVLPVPSVEELEGALVEAIVSILSRLVRPADEATAQAMDDAHMLGGSLKLVLCSEEWLGSESPPPPTALALITCHSAEEVRDVLKGGESLRGYRGAGGVLLLVYGMVLTRGLEDIKADMDDPNNTLTGQFGHCTQELLNLLLLGRAVSNVWDGDRELGGEGSDGMSGMVLKGVPHRPPIGYLTHLEALRYVQVGSLYKSPVWPLWIVGSTSHFTVLFATDTACNEESEEEKLLMSAQRSFKAHDPSEGGFIDSNLLATVLLELGVVVEESKLRRLKSQAEVPGAGIIVWQEFWRVVSPLLRGGGQGAEASSAGDSPPSHSHPSNRPRSDSDLARELQAQFDAGNMDVSLPAPATPPQVEGSGSGRPRSDSDVAREMQQAFDNEATATANPTPTPQQQSQQQPSGSEGAADLDRVTHCSLYHYNGLVGPGGRSARLVKLSLYKRVGSSSSSLGSGGGGGSVPRFGGSPIGTGSAFACPIEEVLGTKWPGARFDWHGQPPPSID